MPILDAPVVSVGAGTRGRVTAGAGAVLALLGLLVWAAGLALAPAAGVAGAAADRTGMMFDAQVDTARLLRHELLDARVIGLVVVVVGLALVVAGRPRVAGRRPAAALAACAVVLVGANAGWTLLPAAPVAVTAGSTAAALAAVLAVVRRLPGGRPDDRLGTGAAAWPALLAAGWVWGLTYAPSDSAAFRPLVGEAHVLLVLAARELVLVAAVVAACAVGTRWVGARVAGGAAVVGIGTTAHLAAPHGLIDDAAALTLLGLSGVAVLVLVWSGEAAPGTARRRQAVGAAVAGVLGGLGLFAYTVPGFLLGLSLLPLAATSNDETGPVTFGSGIVHALVLLGVHRVVGRAG